MQGNGVARQDENERAEYAFSVWSRDGNQNLRQTAQLTGIPYRTIHYYASTRNWAQRHLEQMTPEAERGALIARNRMRMRLPELEEELWQIITGKAPLRTPKGTIVTDQDGNPILDYYALPRDRAYAIKLYLEYSMARLLPEEIAAPHTAQARAPIGDGMSVADAAAAIIEATVHDISGDDKRRRR